jgi:homospermidine synthase
MVIRHGESFTMSDHLTVWGDEGVPVYRPTVHYAYHPADVAVNSVLELRMRNWELQPRQRILNDEIVTGRDELGLPLMGHDYSAWWTGSLLSIEEARAIVPHQNATTLQVAGSIIGAVSWMIDHPNAGLRMPDELPWEPVLKVASHYLGTFHSAPTDWDPLRNRTDLFAQWADERDGVDTDDRWQFSNFLVS